MLLENFGDIRKTGVKVKYQRIFLFNGFRFGFEKISTVSEGSPMKTFVNKPRFITLALEIVPIFTGTFGKSSICGTVSTESKGDT